MGLRAHHVWIRFSRSSQHGVSVPPVPPPAALPKTNVAVTRYRTYVTNGQSSATYAARHRRTAKSSTEWRAKRGDGEKQEHAADAARAFSGLGHVVSNASLDRARWI